MGNKEAWLELLGFAEYAKEANSRIRREEEETRLPRRPRKASGTRTPHRPGWAHHHSQQSQAESCRTC